MHVRYNYSVMQKPKHLAQRYQLLFAAKYKTAPCTAIYLKAWSAEPAKFLLGKIDIILQVLSPAKSTSCGLLTAA